MAIGGYSASDKKANQPKEKLYHKLHPSSPPTTPSLDTLAQLRKNSKAHSPEDSLTLKPQTKFGDNETLIKRARAKYFTMGLILRLVDIKDSPLIKSYWNTWHCAKDLELIGDHIVTHYCKNRWCFVCNRIRTAEHIKKYLPIIKAWDNKKFVTLTIPNCSGEDLKESIGLMETQFNRIKDLYRKTHDKLIGIRKLEVTYNSVRKDYHPHYHLIINSDHSAEFILDEWLERFETASMLAQDIRDADDNSVFELFKYFTKVVSTQSTNKNVYINSLDTIFNAVRGKRTFQGFGFTLPKEIYSSNEEIEEISKELEARTIYKWIQECHDWYDYETGEALTNYVPSPTFKEFIENNITVNQIEQTRPNNFAYNKEIWGE